MERNDEFEAASENNTGQANSISCGKYRIMQLALLVLMKIPLGYQVFMLSFTGTNPSWRCTNITSSMYNLTGTFKKVK